MVPPGGEATGRDDAGPRSAVRRGPTMSADLPHPRQELPDVCHGTPIFRSVLAEPRRSTRRPSGCTGWENAGAGELPGDGLAEVIARASRRAAAAPRGRRRCAMPLRSAGRPGPRSRCCRSRPARTGSRRCRPRWRRGPAAPRIGRLDGGPRVRVAGVAGVVEVQAQRQPGATSAATSVSACTCGGTPTPIVSANATSSGGSAAQAASTSRDPGRADLALERAAERGRERQRASARPAARARAASRRPRRRSPLGGVDALVAAAEGVGRRPRRR